MWIPVFPTEISFFFPLSCHVSNPYPVSKFEADQRRWSCHVEIIPPPPPPSERKLVISQWLWGDSGDVAWKQRPPHRPHSSLLSSVEVGCDRKRKSFPPWDAFVQWVPGEVSWWSVVIYCVGEKRKSFSVQQGWQRRRERRESCSCTEYMSSGCTVFRPFLCCCEYRNWSLLQLISHCSSKNKHFALCHWRTDVKTWK